MGIALKKKFEQEQVKEWTQIENTSMVRKETIEDEFAEYLTSDSPEDKMIDNIPQEQIVILLNVESMSVLRATIF